jgi:hypothetical protein
MLGDWGLGIGDWGLGPIPNPKVVSKNVLIDIDRLDKSRVVIADFVIGDETGTIKMRLRNGMR